MKTRRNREVLSTEVIQFIRNNPSCTVAQVQSATHINIWRLFGGIKSAYKHAEVKFPERKIINNPISQSADLAEAIGIMMGDGCLSKVKRKDCTAFRYHTMIAFNKNELQYMYYVRDLFTSLFPRRFRIQELKSEFLVMQSSNYVGEQLINNGLKYGDKVHNKITIPSWIFQNNEYIRRFIRGFFDTDGSVYKKYDKYAQIEIKLGCSETLHSVKQALLALGFNPTNIIKRPNRQFFSYRVYLSKQDEIKKFFDIIQPMNIKHAIRYMQIKESGAAGI